MQEENQVNESKEVTESQEAVESQEVQSKKNSDTETGEIVNVTNFGAFVKLSNGEEGLVHISEIANEYITDINKYVKVGDAVTVKLLGRNNKNKLELSIKKAIVNDPEPALFIHKKSSNSEFEDKMTKFLKRSEEKLIDIRRNLKNKQGITKRKR